MSVPLADEKNQHTEDPLRNAGRTVALEREGDRIYATLEIAKPEVAEAIRNGTVSGISAYLHMGYTDTRDGQKKGAALLHSCLTNRPYVLGLEPFEEVIAATNDGLGETVMLTYADEPVVIAPEEWQPAGYAAPPNDSGLIAALTAVLRGDDSDALALTAGMDEISQTVVGAVAEVLTLSQRQQAEIGNLQLTARRLHQTNAEQEIDGLISQGRLQPRLRDDFIALAMTDRPRMDRLLPTAGLLELVRLNAQAGYGPDERGVNSATGDVSAEIARLTTSEHTSRYFDQAGQFRGRRDSNGQAPVRQA